VLVRVGSREQALRGPLLHLLLSGAEDAEYGSRRQRVESGSLLLFAGAGEILLRPHGNAQAVTMQLPATTLSELPLEGLILLPHDRHATGSWAGALGEALLRSANPAKALAAAGDALGQLPLQLAELASHCLADVEGLAAKRQQTRFDLLARAERARRLLDGNLHRPVPLWELQKAAGISGFHLARAFAELWGEPPATYHRRRRLAHAEKLLAIGKTAREVAEATGFSNPASFHRAYVRHFATTPGQQAKRIGS
jgi:AraC-like DNA-binding protein